jgi:hypothetical protein
VVENVFRPEIDVKRREISKTKPGETHDIDRDLLMTYLIQEHQIPEGSVSVRGQTI